eukprot:Stramenopile-MAST_4_protein_566
MLRYAGRVGPVLFAGGCGAGMLFFPSAPILEFRERFQRIAFREVLRRQQEQDDVQRRRYVARPALDKALLERLENSRANTFQFIVGPHRSGKRSLVRANVPRVFFFTRDEESEDMVERVQFLKDRKSSSILWNLSTCILKLKSAFLKDTAVTEHLLAERERNASYMKAMLGLYERVCLEDQCDMQSSAVVIAMDALVDAHELDALVEFSQKNCASVVLLSRHPYFANGLNGAGTKDVSSMLRPFFVGDLEPVDENEEDVEGPADGEQPEALNGRMNVKQFLAAYSNVRGEGGEDNQPWLQREPLVALQSVYGGRVGDLVSWYEACVTRGEQGAPTFSTALSPAAQEDSVRERADSLLKLFDFSKPLADRSYDRPPFDDVSLWYFFIRACNLQPSAEIMCGGAEDLVSADNMSGYLTPSDAATLLNDAMILRYLESGVIEWQPTRDNYRVELAPRVDDDDDTDGTRDSETPNAAPFALQEGYFTLSPLTRHVVSHVLHGAHGDTAVSQYRQQWMSDRRVVHFMNVDLQSLAMERQEMQRQEELNLQAWLLAKQMYHDHDETTAGGDEENGRGGARPSQRTLPRREFDLVQIELEQRDHHLAVMGDELNRRQAVVERTRLAASRRLLSERPCA